jgi:hypothetical protein
MSAIETKESELTNTIELSPLLTTKRTNAQMESQAFPEPAVVKR